MQQILEINKTINEEIKIAEKKRKATLFKYLHKWKENFGRIRTEILKKQFFIQNID